MKNTALGVGGVVFAAVAAAQFTRFVFGWEVLLEGRVVPVWLSGIAFLAALGLSVWMFMARAKP